jgi:uncharacterized membrane protein YccC
MKLFERVLADNLLGVRFAVNVFVGTTLLWILLEHFADTNPLWAIASMVAASEPVVKNAVRMFRARIINVSVGCVIGLAVVAVGGTSEWKLPIAMSIAVLVSSYVVHVPTMWRQAPITAALVIAAVIAQHSKMSGVEHGLHKVGEVILGCLMGLLVSWLMSRVWPLQAAEAQPAGKGTKD